ncbi:MAG TPA: NDP-sugar synthase [Acidimicrobiales bacterium]|jgi:mannose-1-phosphate guanylyltransferase|nr:NDP-sugar synthase [Acidimicrobiales bacterium]
MQAIILVGGKGTRLRPLTFETPKQMLPLVGVPMIECVLESLARHGVTDAVLSLGYLPDRFSEAYPSNLISGVRVTYAVESEPLDTAGAIRFAASCSDVAETFLVVNGDVLTDLDVTALLDFHRDHEAEVTIALHPVEDPSHFGVVPTHEDGRVIAFVEKPPANEAPTNLINAGTYVFEPRALDRIALEGRVSVERETFPALAAAGTLFAMADHAYWLDTGTPRLYLQANVDILKGRNSQHEFADIVDGAWRAKTSTVDPSATVLNSVVDVDCVVGADVVLEGSVLLPGAVVQSGSEIRSSIIGPEAVIGSGSILGPTCVVGAKEHVAADSQLSGDVRLGGM